MLATSLLAGRKVVPDGGRPADYGFDHVSNKLYMVIYTYSSADAQEVLDESWQMCGFNAFRLLNIAHDSLNIDAKQQLVECVMAIGHWSVKGIVQIDSLTQEAAVRIRALEEDGIWY